MTHPQPLARYQAALAEGFVQDAAQAAAVDALQALHDQLHSGVGSIKGLYLWGPVGRGKTWLMDSFHDSLEVAARRQHFHHFMRWVHQQLFRLNGTPEPLQRIARELAGEIRVLCLDEFFVNDIGDASILGALVQALVAEGVVIVTTSNQPPDQLYAGGWNRERLLPAIDTINTRMQVLSVDGGEDHRLHPGRAMQRYWVQQEARTPIRDRFMASMKGAATAGPLSLGSRSLQVVQRDSHQLWCTYAQLCEAPLAANDYILLCDRFEQILLSDVPCLAAEQREARIARGTEDAASRVEAGDRVLPRLSRHDNGARRFIALVDECYDRSIPLWIEAEVPMEQLYPQGYLEFAFRRTLSRLKEMQTERFGRR